MLNSRKFLLVAGALGLAGFLLGVIYLFQLRFEAGDIYPAYSSLRSDPLGAEVLYQSLEQLPGFSVRRFFEPADKLQGGPNRVLLVAGVSRLALPNMSHSDYRALQNFLVAGGRVVFSLTPSAGPREDNEPQNPFLPPERKDVVDERKSLRRVGTNEEDFVTEPVDFLETNGLTLKSDSLLADNEGTTESVRAITSDEYPGLPRTISWHGADYFDGRLDEWRVVYRRGDHPVMIERNFGKGSLVLCGDSYFFSNEALRKERHAELLLWLLGDRHEIIFDETHLGIEQQLGIASLMRRYRLEGLIFGLLVVAGLFVWKNSTSLVPPPGEETAGGEGVVVAGRESGAGFASLLRRSIPPSDLAQVCFDEWRPAFARDPRVAARLPEIQRLIDEEKGRSGASRRPLETCRQIQQILNQRNL